MIFNKKRPTDNDLSEKYSDFLQYDTVAHLKEAFGLMGRRFIGQPRKVQIVNGIARYVREHPLEVLQKCESDTLMYIKKMIEMGKGSHITIGEPNIYHLQIQRMELVLTYYDQKNHYTEFYLLDELHDIFAPHIDEAYRNPSETLQKDMVKGLERMANQIKSAKDSEAKAKELLLEAMLIQVAYECDSIRNVHAKKLHQKFPSEMFDKELDEFEAELNQQEQNIHRVMNDLQEAIKEAPAAVPSKESAIKSATEEVNETLVRIDDLRRMVDQMKRS